MFKHLLTILLTAPILFGNQTNQLYADKCAKCHGEKGEKKALGSSRAIGGWERTAVEEALLAYRGNRRNQTGRGVIMRGVASQLSEAEIKALASYIATLKQ